MRKTTRAAAAAALPRLPHHATSVARGLAVALAVLLLASLSLAPGPDAHAIGNGVPDGDRHPNVGMLTVEFGGDRFPVCSGFYAGPHKDAEDAGVFVTAGHCLFEFPADGVPASRLWVTFDTNASVDPETSVVTATGWHQASELAFDPQFGQNHANAKDYGVVVLEDAVDVPPVELPTAGLLDEMAARGGLRPRTVFDNVGYGVIPGFKQGPPRLADGTGRMFSTSRFQALTPHWLRLLMNSDAGDGNGGSCFGDSGSPKLLHATNLAVAITGGGDPICRAQNYNQRLDVPDARAFLGRYLSLPQSDVRPRPPNPGGGPGV